MPGLGSEEPGSFREEQAGEEQGEIQRRMTGGGEVVLQSSKYFFFKSPKPNHILIQDRRLVSIKEGSKLSNYHSLNRAQCSGCDRFGHFVEFL